MKKEKKKVDETALPNLDSEIANPVMEDSNMVKCSYPSCENKILAEGEYNMCEPCRVLSVRNTIALIINPAEAHMERRDAVFSTLITRMKVDEILNAVQKIEWAYLEFQKVIKIHNLKPGWGSRAPVWTDAEEVELIRKTKDTEAPSRKRIKKETKKLDGAAKIADMLGISLDQARKMQDEVFDL